jgi:hypothetical protein
MPKRTLHKILAHEKRNPDRKKEELSDYLKELEESMPRRLWTVEVLEREGTCTVFSFISTVFTFTFFIQLYNLKDTQY